LIDQQSQEQAMNTVDLSTSTQSEIVEASSSTWKDWVGITASVGCAIHCAAMPFVFAYLPALGLSFLADESFHKWMALVCFLIAIAAFVPGIRKHRNWTPISIASIGLALITFAAFGLAGECCASCASNESITHAVGGGAECDHCNQCASCNTSAIASSPKSNAPKDLLSTLAPWITPVGGVLLVGAHLLNRRYGCLCGCCGPEALTGV